MTVTFSVDDAELLYSIPEPGGNIAQIVRAYMFINRTVPPPYSLLHDCFTKAIQCGILQKDDCYYYVTSEWYERIHAHDGREGNEIESMLVFQEDFVGKQLPVISTEHTAFSEQDYDAVLKGI